MGDAPLKMPSQTSKQVAASCITPGSWGSIFRRLTLPFITDRAGVCTVSRYKARKVVPSPDNLSVTQPHRVQRSRFADARAPLHHPSRSLAVV